MAAATDLSLRGLLRERRVVPLVMALVGGLALANGIVDPDRARRWWAAALLLPAVWAGMALRVRAVAGARQPGTDISDVRRYFQSAATLFVLAAGVPAIAVSGLELWTGLGGPPLSPHAMRRSVGLLLAAVLVCVGNMLPKILTPLALLPRRQAHLVTGARKFLGATLLVLGVAVALAFLAAPVEVATRMPHLAGLAVAFSALGAIVSMNVAARRQVE